MRMRIYSHDELIAVARTDNAALDSRDRKTDAELTSIIRRTVKAQDVEINRVACDKCFAKHYGDLAATDAAISYRKRAQTCWGNDWEQRALESFEQSHRDKEHRTVNVSRAFEWGREWDVSNPKSWAIIYGHVGTGKTYLARCVLNKAMQQGLSAREIEAADLVQLNNTWSDNVKKFNAILKADVFLIEEVGLVSWTKDALVALRRVVDAAYKNRKRGVVLMTSNLSADELMDAWYAPVKGTGWETIYNSMIDRMRKIQRLVMDGETLRRGAQNVLPGVA